MSEQDKTNWNNRYLTTKVTNMPWYNPDLDKDLEKALNRLKLTSGTFLDLGTGPATQAKKLADKGFTVTGTDISTEAIHLAKATFENIVFIEDDILETKLTGKFDYIFDRGCFHILDVDKWGVYSKNIFHLLNESGRVFLKCFSNKMPEMGTEPQRISEEDIKNTFQEKFIIEELHHTTFSNNLPQTKALFVVLRKNIYV
jgi:cyclopropane fatty-acyl-phospholipid synthase-like methyltransferase